MGLSQNQQLFFELLRAGLWEKEARLSQYKCIDYNKLMELTEEQSVDGLITAGLEHVIDSRVPQEVLLQFIGTTLQIEQKNLELNKFIAQLMEKFRKECVSSLLIKGQGIAQCYERPLWRASGDVDLLLDANNYRRAKDILLPIAQEVEPEYKLRQHLGLTIDGEVVELHGSLRGSLSRKINAVNDKVQKECFEESKVRTWRNGDIDVYLPAADNDIIFVFTHILQHFFVEGIGLRQICDWCRLLWTYRSEINVSLLEERLKRAGIMSEWRAFGALAVEYLGMPAEAMPFYSPDKKWKAKADKICSFIMEVGNFGQNRDMSYYCKYPYLVRKAISLGRRCGDLIRNAWIFPMDSLRFFPYMMYNGLSEAVRR